MKSLALLAALLAACKDDPPPQPAAPRPVMFEATAEPFGAVADVAPGMTLEEVRQRIPGIERAAAATGDLMIDSLRDAEPSYQVHYRRGRVRELHIMGVELADAARWGSGTRGIGAWRDTVYYFDAAHRWEASILRRGRRGDVRFVALFPVADLFGSGPRPTLAGVAVLGAREVEGALRARGLTVSEHDGAFFVDPVTTEYGTTSAYYSYGPDGRATRLNGGVLCYAEGACKAALAWFQGRGLTVRTAENQVDFDAAL